MSDYLNEQKEYERQRQRAATGGGMPGPNDSDAAWSGWNAGRDERNFNKTVDDFCKPFKPGYPTTT